MFGLVWLACGGVYGWLDSDTLKHKPVLARYMRWGRVACSPAAQSVHYREAPAMLFCRDSEKNDWFYIDRQIDDHADHFLPCTDCREKLDTLAQSNTAWFPGQLCGEDYTAMECLSDAGGERIQIMDPVREPMSWPSQVAIPEPSTSRSDDGLGGPMGNIME
jgi:hypothetical protein